MKIVVGLGNPGIQYETTRHNAGFLAIDRLVESWQGSRPTQQFNAEVSQAIVQNDRVLLIKPMTYMNLSGNSVSAFLDYYRCEPEELIVIHDELDLPAMSLRIKIGGGAGGHNGLKSIDEKLGKKGNNYFRIRIGIGHPRNPKAAEGTTEKPLQISPANYVLQSFSDQELIELDPLLDELVKVTQEILIGNVQKAMNQYHRSKLPSE